MASWQYHHADDKKPLVSTSNGYYVSYPYNQHEEPDNQRYTALLEFNGNKLYLWAHDISFGFQLGGSTAQSHHYHEFYAHNLSQPIVRMKGQTHSQEQYAEIAEFVRRGQSWALKPIDKEGKGNTMALTIPSSGIVDGKHTHAHAHQGHHFRGHIKNIERRASRFVNAPEFSFEFIVVTAYQGVFSTYFDEASATKERLAVYMQIPNQIRKKSSVTFVVDPDSEYDKGDRPG